MAEKAAKSTWIVVAGSCPRHLRGTKKKKKQKPKQKLKQQKPNLKLQQPASHINKSPSESDSDLDWEWATQTPSAHLAINLEKRGQLSAPAAAPDPRLPAPGPPRQFIYQKRRQRQMGPRLAKLAKIEAEVATSAY